MLSRATSKILLSHRIRSGFEPRSRRLKHQAVVWKVRRGAILGNVVVCRQ
jgi:hypothetical protein